MWESTLQKAYVGIIAEKMNHPILSTRVMSPLDATPRCTSLEYDFVYPTSGILIPSALFSFGSVSRIFLRRRRCRRVSLIPRWCERGVDTRFFRRCDNCRLCCFLGGGGNPRKAHMWGIHARARGMFGCRMWKRGTAPSRKQILLPPQGGEDPHSGAIGAKKSDVLGRIRRICVT